MKLFRKIVINMIALFSFVFSFAAPMFIFARYFQQSLDEFARFDDGYAYVFSILGVIFSLLYLRLTPRYFKFRFYRVVVIAIYFLVYAQACEMIIWDHRIEFGTTWESSYFPMTAFINLVGPYFYILPAVGALWHLASHWWLGRR